MNYTIARDEAICQMLDQNAIVCSFEDQVVEEKGDNKADGLTYTVYTPYKNGG
jgi:deoxyribodipyrimidine photo-lyase